MKAKDILKKAFSDVFMDFLDTDLGPVLRAEILSFIAANTRAKPGERPGDIYLHPPLVDDRQPVVYSLDGLTDDILGYEDDHALMDATAEIMEACAKRLRDGAKRARCEPL